LTLNIDYFVFLVLWQLKRVGEPVSAAHCAADEKIVIGIKTGM